MESIGPHFVEVDEGIVRHKRYFIPKYYVEGFDGDNLHVALTKDELKNSMKGIAHHLSQNCRIRNI